MHRLIAASLLLSVLLTPLPSLALTPPPFPDMDDSWYGYRDAVNVLQNRGIIDGYPDGTFRPRQTINRAEFLKIIFAARGAEHAVAGDCFTDVKTDDWFAPFVCAAKRRDIITGYADGSFKPNQEVNWAEAMAMLLRAYDWNVTEREGEKWYKPFVDLLDTRHVMPASSYVPWTELTRERAADLLFRVLLYDESKATVHRSPGCNEREGDAPSTTLRVHDLERTYLLTKPRSNAQEPSPLIVAFHGRTNSNDMVRSYMGLDRATSEYFIAYPAAQKNGSSYSWVGAGVGPYGIDDIAFFDEIVAEIAEHECIDMERIYVVGHSLGAWMANTVACLRGGVVRASGTSGGDGITKNCNGPAAALIAHNPKDNLASFAGSERVQAQRVEENGCSWDTSDGEPESLQCVEHRNCNGGADVVFCPFTQETDHRGVFYPHVWPKGLGGSIIEFFDSIAG